VLTLLLACQEPTDGVKPPDDTGVPTEATDTADSTPVTDSVPDSTPTEETGDPETGTDPCADHVDNDADGWADAADPDCAAGVEAGFGESPCNDGVDNDLDGQVDAFDDDCDSAQDDEGEIGLLGEIAVAGATGAWEGDAADTAFGGAIETLPDLDGDGGAELFVVGSVALRARLWWLSPGLSGGRASDAYAEVYGIDASVESAAAGDVDGDGRVDLLVGAPGGDGTVWILPGGPAAGANRVDELPDRFDGASEAGAGFRIDWGADLDGDGAGDLVLGTSNVGSLGAVVVPGPLAGGVQSLEDAPVEVFHRDLRDGTGAGLATGDVDGDGWDDLLLGAPGADATNADHGRVYVLAGPLPSGSVSVRVAAAEWVGEADHQYVGREVRLVGDVNGDGQEDVLVGTGDSADPTFPGRAYLLYAPGTGGEQSLAAAEVLLEGEAAGDRVGAGLAGIGDVDADGRADFAVAAGLSDRSGEDAGAVYLFYGSIAPGSYVCDRAHGTVLGGQPFAGTGTAVSGGDLDADGHDDLVVGAPGVDTGWVYVFAGRER